MESSLSGETPSAASDSFDESPLSSATPPTRYRRSFDDDALGSAQVALQVAEEYKQGLPSRSRKRTVVKVLNQCCVSGTYVMTLPSGYAKENMPRGKASLILRNKSDHGQWKMKWNWKMQPVIGAGWKAFCVQNRLVKGDVVVFTKDKEQSSADVVTFHVKIFKRRSFGGGSGGGDGVMARARDPSRNNDNRAMMLVPKKEDDELLEIQEIPGVTKQLGFYKQDTDEMERIGSSKRMRMSQNERMENSSEEDDDEDHPAPAAGMEAGALVKLNTEPLITVRVKKTRSAAESEELAVHLRLHSSKFERISRNLLGSSNSIINKNSDGGLNARISANEFQKVLRLAFPLYDATPV